MSMKVSKMNMTNHPKEKLVAHGSDVTQFKRPDTATLERPSILDPSYLRKLDMSILSREKLMNIKNLLAKPHRKSEQKSDGSSYDSILSDTSINISDESIDRKLFLGNDDDSIKRNKRANEKNSKSNKKKNQKTCKSKNVNPTKGKSSNENMKKSSDEYGEGYDWDEEGDYQANKEIINRTYRIKHSKRQSIINPSEDSNQETAVTTKNDNLTPRSSSHQKLDSLQTSVNLSHLKIDKNYKKSDDNIHKTQPKLIVKKSIALNKYSKKSMENLAMKKSKSKERINVKATDKTKKVVSNTTARDKGPKEIAKELVDSKETKSMKANVSEGKKEKLDKVKYETVPRQKKNSEPIPSKPRPATSHRRSISEVTRIDLESKENTTPKKTFLRKNSKDMSSPNVVRKFMDPITGKLRTVDEIPSAVKKIKETLKVPGKSDERRSPRKSYSSSESSPRKSSISEMTSSKLSLNGDVSPRKSIDGFPARKSSMSENYKQCRKASLNIDTTPRKSDKPQSRAERRRSYFGQSSDTMFSTQLIIGEKYEDLFKKSDIIPRDDPVINLVSPIRSDVITAGDMTTTFNNNVETSKTDVLVDLVRNPTLVPPDKYFTDSADLLNMGEYRSLIVTPTFYSDESWLDFSRPEASCTGSLKKYKTIECNLCSKQFGAASFSFHEPHCRQRWLRENSDLPTPFIHSKDFIENDQRGFLPENNVSTNDVLCTRCNNKVPSPLVDIHEEHCQKVHASPSSPSHLSSSPSHLSSSSSPNMSPSRKPRTVICYLCGREFGKSSIGIHEPQCLKKWHIENDKLPSELKRPEPTRPEVILVTGSDKIDTQAMGEAAFKSYVAQLVPCGKCGRKFFPDRVVVHENVCKGLETRK